MENNNKKSSVFYSYCLDPQVKFETQEEGEKVILLLRSHPFTQIGWIFKSILLFVFLFILNFFIKNLFDSGGIFVINLFLLVFILSYVLFNVINWYFNVGIITNKKIIDIDIDAILYKEINVAPLDKIQDITVKSGGYFEAIFDYGSIYSQTAGTNENVEFLDVPFPTDAVQIINKLISRRYGT
jgi:membrane protein YdbS with pleckstrin-like domain